jgi:hypothetical protein
VAIGGYPRVRGVLADLVEVRDAIQSRADRLRYLLAGRTNRFILAQVEAYEDAAAELTEILARYDPRPREADE